MNIGEQINQLKLAQWNMNYTYWKSEVLFSGKWWILIGLIALCYAVWWKLVDKRRLTEFLLFGSLISVGRILLDIFGNNLVLWSYNIREIPIVPSPFLHDFTITPLSYMLAYQYSSTWSSFTVWNTITAAGISFVFLPLLAAFGYLTLIKWNYTYTFILLILMAAMSRFVVKMSKQMEKAGEAKMEISQNLIAQPVLKPADREDGCE